jgi:hypothetical protein
VILPRQSFSSHAPDFQATFLNQYRPPTARTVGRWSLLSDGQCWWQGAVTEGWYMIGARGHVGLLAIDCQ